MVLCHLSSIVRYKNIKMEESLGAFDIGNRAFFSVFQSCRIATNIHNFCNVFCRHRKIDMSTVVEANELHVYKVIDAAAETVRNYNADCISSPVIATSGPGTDTTSRNDWCGLYTQFKSAHTLGTIPYRWEHSGTTVAALVKVTIHSPIRIAVLDGTFWHNGNISGQTKADMAKQQLGVPPNEPLVTYLGRSNTALLVWETAEEPELIFSHDLFAGLHSSEDCLALFQRHDCRPVTSRWRNFKNHQWKLWQDVGQDCLLEIPDLSFDCILDGTNN